MSDPLSIYLDDHLAPPPVGSASPEIDLERLVARAEAQYRRLEQRWLAVAVRVLSSAGSAR